MYRRIIRPILFRFKPEAVHRFALGTLRFFGGSRLGEWMLGKMFRYDSPRLEREVFGIKFPNPVGLAAGYDTDARHYRPLRAMGFGFVEAGTITPRPQPGNIKPRVFRLPTDKALVNRTGYPNAGMERVLDNLRKRNKRRHVVVGANISANTLTQWENIPADYLKLFRNLYQYVDYFVINVTGGGNFSDALQQGENIRNILHELFEFRRGQNNYRPLLLKISPDWPASKIDDAVNILIDTPLDGLVVAGVTQSRNGLSSGEKKISTAAGGGLSGAPLLERTMELIKYAGEKMQWRYPIIASGGAVSEADVLRLLDAGASLVEIYTGLTYNGPSFPRKICKYLDEKFAARDTSDLRGGIPATDEDSEPVENI